MGKEVEFSPFPSKFSQHLSWPGSLTILPSEQRPFSAAVLCGAFPTGVELRGDSGSAHRGSADRGQPCILAAGLASVCPISVDAVS